MCCRFPSASDSRTPAKRQLLAGDVAISADIALQNSDPARTCRGEEIKILALHGILHLAGFDHERDNGEMARKEAKLRRALRLPAALIERVETNAENVRRSPRKSDLARQSTEDGMTSASPSVLLLLLALADAGLLCGSRLSGGREISFARISGQHRRLRTEGRAGAGAKPLPSAAFARRFPWRC